MSIYTSITITKYTLYDYSDYKNDKTMTTQLKSIWFCCFLSFTLPACVQETQPLTEQSEAAQPCKLEGKVIKITDGDTAFSKLIFELLKAGNGPTDG